jgi:hypothetical protein
MIETRCRQCGVALTDTAAFCPRCGHNISGNRAPAAPIVTTRQTSPAVALLIAGAVLLLLLFALLFVGYRVASTPQPVRAVQFPMTPGVPSQMNGFATPGMSIRDGSGREITDPAMRAQIEAAIERNNQLRGANSH